MQVAKLSKASFLAELKGIKASAQLPLPGTGVGVAARGSVAQPQMQPPAAGWDVLQEGYGLPGQFLNCLLHPCSTFNQVLTSRGACTGTTKMKAWDQAANVSDDEPAAEQLQDFSDDSDEGG